MPDPMRTQGDQRQSDPTAWLVDAKPGRPGGGRTTSSNLQVLDLLVQNSLTSGTVGRPRKFDTDTVVEQAIETFRVHGYGDTSPRTLSERLGIGKGSLYNAFGSKHELFLTSLERYSDAALADLKALIDSELPIRERVRRMLLDAVDSDLSDPERCGCLVVNSATELGSRDDKARRVLGQSFDATAAVLHGAFLAAQQAGEIEADRDVRALAGLVQSAMIGLRVLVKTTDDRARLESIVDATVAAI